MHDVARSISAETGTGLIQAELGFVVLLSIAALVAIVNRRLRLPYTVALVLVGLALAFVPHPLQISGVFTSSFILVLLVPPLIFEATLQIRWEALRLDLTPILILAVGGTLFGTAIVAGIVKPLLGVPTVAAVAFGALIAATDPVAVVAFFRRLGVGQRLRVLVEGESLFNDAAAIVLFNLAIGAGALGTGAGFSWWYGVREFAATAFMGLAVGTVLGYIVSQIVLRNIDDHLIETATTLALAYGSYVAAEYFHWSGILAVVVAGLLVGNLGMRNTSPTTKIAIDNFWEFMAFIANSLVFLLIGLGIDIARFPSYLLPVFVAVMAIIVSRAVVVYGLSWLHEAAGAANPLPLKYRRVLFWGGLRGAIGLALALTLTDDKVGGAGIAEELRFMTFGVVLFTLVVQGLTIERVIDALGLSDRPTQLKEQQKKQALIYAARAGRRELDRLSEDGILAGDVWRSMSEQCEDDISARNLALREHFDQWQELEQEMVLQARERVLRAERAAVADAGRRGLISEDVQEELVRDLDSRVAAILLIRDSSSYAFSAGDEPQSDDGEADAGEADAGEPSVEKPRDDQPPAAGGCGSAPEERESEAQPESEGEAR